MSTQSFIRTRTFTNTSNHTHITLLYTFLNQEAMKYQQYLTFPEMFINTDLTPFLVKKGIFLSVLSPHPSFLHTPTQSTCFYYHSSSHKNNTAISNNWSIVEPRFLTLSLAYQDAVLANNFTSEIRSHLRIFDQKRKYLVGTVFVNGPADRGSIPGRVMPKIKYDTWCHLA